MRFSQHPQVLLQIVMLLPDLVYLSHIAFDVTELFSGSWFRTPPADTDTFLNATDVELELSSSLMAFRVLFFLG